jgi:competence protein ComEC
LSVLIAFAILISGKQKDGVFFLDVGQGDSILIQKGNIQVLIDGGENLSVLYGLGEYMPFGDMEIELVVLTHPHADHINGLLYVFERYGVGEVWFNNVDYKSEIYEYLLTLDIPLKQVEEGTRYILDDWAMEVLFSSDIVYEKDNNLNNASIVLQLETDNYKYLLMGDAEVEVEELLTKKDILEDIDILKSGHHCSRTASSEIFLNIIKPEIAICSYGEGNKFGHPHEETIDRFKEKGIQILSTKEEGNIWLL